MKEQSIKISFLITHFNRPNQLEMCVNKIKDLKLDCCEIVVSDDCSKKEVVDLIKTFSIDQLVLAPFNQGLGANINKGIKACKGEYLIYCQEDFNVKESLKHILNECYSILDENNINMIRFISNVNFNKRFKLTRNVDLIPKFSFFNFYQNFYQYSDHPFIVRRLFFEQNGFYLENTSGDYGETEYAIRVCKSKIRIGITTENQVVDALNNFSVIDRKVKQNKIKLNKSVKKLLRAFRMYFEWLFYNKNKRGLITYKNGRQ
ncbi:glycosyltransferase family 2 protein [Olleya namhaensis]|uniref:glycosyltransferase family 2 protein n=1 Tax=Olleya namhaensis TaxID=1144750 RepID=UPI00248F516E|nr:glycosyltransferase [Olleya namhaensis]